MAACCEGQGQLGVAGVVGPWTGDWVGRVDGSRRGYQGDGRVWHPPSVPAAGDLEWGVGLVRFGDTAGAVWGGGHFRPISLTGVRREDASYRSFLGAPAQGYQGNQAVLQIVAVLGIQRVRCMVGELGRMGVWIGPTVLEAGTQGPSPIIPQKLRFLFNLRR